MRHRAQGQEQLQFEPPPPPLPAPPPVPAALEPMSPPSQTPSSETTQPEELSKDSTSWKAYVTSLEMDDLVKKFKREYGRTKSENHPTPFGLAMNRAMSTTRERLTARKKKKGYEIVVTEIKRRVTMGRSISAVGRKNRPKDMGIVEPIPLPD